MPLNFNKVHFAIGAIVSTVLLTSQPVRSKISSIMADKQVQGPVPLIEAPKLSARVLPEQAPPYPQPLEKAVDQGIAAQTTVIPRSDPIPVIKVQTARVDSTSLNLDAPSTPMPVVQEPEVKPLTPIQPLSKTAGKKKRRQHGDKPASVADKQHKPQQVH